MSSTSSNVVTIVVALVAATGIGAGIYWATTQHPSTSPSPKMATAQAPVQAPSALVTRPAHDGALVRVFGVVTDASTGAPIDNAQVGARKALHDNNEEARVSAVSSTDKSGVYEIRITPGTFTAVVCMAPGYTRQRDRLPEGNPAEARIDFQLVRGGTVTGQITDKTTGAPVEGIGIELAGAQENMFERMRAREADPGRAGSSTADGSYMLDGVPAGSYRALLDVRDTGYLYKSEDAVSLKIEAGKTYGNIDFRVERGGEIAGRVINAQTGAPITGAQVVAMPTQMIQQAMRRMGSGPMPGLGPNETHTGEQGEFTLRGLEFDSEYYAVACADGLATGSSDVIPLDRTKATPHVEIKLTRGSTVSGAAHYPDGKPARGSRLFLFPDAGEGWALFMGPRDMRTGDDGAFTIENVAAGSYMLRPEGDFSGGLLGRSARPQNKAARVDVDGVRDVTGIDVVVEKETAKSEDDPAQGSIKGKVLGTDGLPVADVRVEARQAGSAGRSYGATTEDDGTFELAELRGPIFDLSVSSDEGIARQPAVPVGTDVTLRLTPPASISGFVVDRAGGPVPGCTVRLTNLAESGKVSSFVSVMQEMLGARPGGESTDINGAFEFTKLAPGSYAIKANGAAHGTAETGPLALAAGQDMTGVQITLSPGVRVSGIVFGPNGERVRGATVRLGPVTDDAAANLVSAFVPAGVLKTAGTTTTGDDGTFTIPNVAPGTYRLVVSHSDYAMSIDKNFTVSSGNDVTALNITLQKGGEARGTFTVNGEPQANAMIVMLGEAGMEIVQTDGQGRFDVRGLTAGPHLIAAFDPTRLALNGAGLQFTPQVVDITDAQAADISLGGRGGVTVSGSLSGGGLGTLTLVALRKPGGTSLANLDLANFSNLLESLRSLGSQTVAGPDGTFSMDNIPPGDYTLEVYTMNFDESNPDIHALLNLPRTPAYSAPVQIGPNQPPLQIDLTAP